MNTKASTSTSKVNEVEYITGHKMDTPFPSPTLSISTPETLLHFFLKNYPVMTFIKSSLYIYCTILLKTNIFLKNQSDPIYI